LLKNYAEAQQKYQESLSSDTKACIQESNTAVHQKRRQSLSPDTIARIKESDTAAHQKRQESLLPNEKACMLKINAKE
jgi:hypothetical protein